MIKRHTDFQDMMNVSIETEDKWLNRKLNSHICYGKGGGGGGGNQQQDVPPTLRPYVTDVLNRAKALYGAETQYQPYQGERVVPFTAEELAAQEGITGMVGRGISQDPFLSSAGAYYAPAYGLLGEAGALQAGAAREITADEIMGRMSPYQQAVTDITKREAMKEAQLYGQKLKGQAATTGGFGGSRQAILEAQAAADLGGRLTDIQARGQQEAYMNALAMAEQQRAREMGAGQALSGLSGMYGNLGQQALGQAYRELGYLSGVGEAQRTMGQERADIAYQDFIAQRDFPDTQLQKYSSLIQGFPYQITMPQPFNAPTGMQQFTSGALALGSLGRGLGFFKKGGEVGDNKYPNEGLKALAQERPDIVSKMGYKKGGGISTVYRAPGNRVGNPLPKTFTLEELKQYLAETRFDKAAREEEIALKKRQAESKAMADAAQAILGADPRAGGLAALIGGAGAAGEALAERTAAEQELKGLGKEEREAVVKDYLTVSALEAEEADKTLKKAQARAEELSSGDFELTPTVARQYFNDVVGTVTDYVIDQQTGSIKLKDGRSLNKSEQKEVAKKLEQLRKYSNQVLADPQSRINYDSLLSTKANEIFFSQTP